LGIGSRNAFPIAMIVTHLFLHEPLGQRSAMLAAYYMGIPVKRVVSIVWAISAAVAPESS
jgi:ribose/xylose/arabinose/galactoside ABC-type transport system permease subunit